jgi:hypothetical protein
LNIATTNANIKCKPFTVLERLNIIMLLAVQMSDNKITEKLGIPVRKVADTMLRRSDTGENVLRLLQIIQIYIHVVSSQKVKKDNFSIKIF